MTRQQNSLRNAPYSHHLLLETWNLPYFQTTGFFPEQAQVDDKYWPPVGRIDNVYGDRHLFCHCVPVGESETTGGQA